MFKKLRRFIGRRALKKYYAEYLHEEQGLSKKEAHAKAYARMPAIARTSRGKASWLTSEEGRRETDLEFVLTLTEMLMKKMLSGELTQEDLTRLIASDNPFREIRLKTMTDKKLEELLASREAHEQKVLERLHAPAPAAAKPLLSTQELFKRAMVFVQGTFKQPEGPTAAEVQLQQQKRKQYVLEMQRIEKMKMAALANSPEFIESLGAPDHFDSATQQGKREDRIIAKEQQKLRPRLSKEDIAPARPREKTPKEIAEEKMRMVRKLKQGVGGFGSSV